MPTLKAQPNVRGAEKTWLLNALTGWALPAHQTSRNITICLMDLCWCCRACHTKLQNGCVDAPQASAAYAHVTVGMQLRLTVRTAV